MKFSEYRRIRRQEEDEQDNGAPKSAPSVSTQNSTPRFTDIMKEREPQRYAYYKAQEEQKRIDNANMFYGKVDSYLQKSNRNLTSDADYIKNHMDVYTADSSKYADSRTSENDALRQQAFDLMKEAWANTDLKQEDRQKVIDTLRTSALNHKKANKANQGFADYMSQFANQDAFDRTRADEKKKQEIASLSEDELQKKVQDAEQSIKKIEAQENASYAEKQMNPAVKFALNKMGLYEESNLDVTELEDQKHSIEKDIKSYEDAIYKIRQNDAIESLSEETRSALDEYYDFMTNGPSAEKKLLSATGLYDGYARQKDIDELKTKVKNALNAQGLNGDDFDKLYEYYQFSKDEERTQENQDKWQEEYDNSGVLGKIGLNVGTVLTTPLRGITAATENVIAPTYHDEYAPLNTNSVGYDLTNWSDTVRNRTSENIDNGVANFLYQTGMSTADFLSLLPLNVATGNSTSLAIMGTNAATSAAKEATLRGADKRQALLTGLTAGTAEVAFEKVSLDSFWNIARKQGKAATRNAFLNTLVQAGIEGSEEVFTDIANSFTDRLINGGLSEYYQRADSYYKQGMSMADAKRRAGSDWASDLAMDFLGGAVSGGAIGAGASINTLMQGKKSGYTMQDYADVAEGIDTERSSYESQEDYDKAMEVKNLADDIAQKGDKAGNFEKGLFEQAVYQLTGIQHSETSDIENELEKEQEFGLIKTNDNTVQELNTVSEQRQSAEGLRVSPQEQISQIASSLSNETVSRAFIADYKEGIPIETYTRAFTNFYDAGYTDMKFEDALKTNDFIAETMDIPTLQGIWYLGQNQAAKVSSEYASQEQKELVDMTAKALGVKVAYADINGANGMYKDGVIYISNKTLNPSMVVLSHELTHSMKENVQEDYAAYENYVIDYFKEYHAKEYADMHDRIAKAYNTADEALIREEIAANASETFLTDADAVNRFVDENRTIAQRIADFLNDFVQKLKNLYQNYKAKGKAAKMLSEDIEVYEKARDLWYQAVNANVEGQELNVTESVTNEKNRYSLKDYDMWDRKDPRVKFHVSHVSEPLKSVGVDGKKEIYFDSKKILRIKSDHPEMTDNVIRNVDKIIKEPIAIMNSASVKGRITLVGELEGENGIPVMLALELNPTDSKGIEIDEIKICSAYTRNNFTNWMKTQDYLWINPNKNKTDNWLKRTRVQFPVGINQYGLIKTISQKQQNSNTKFSLKGEVEETKDLIALHNLTSDKLMKTLDLGGFPMPSIAITNTNIGHTNFGDISCVFYKDTIDPKNKKNKVFGADAWTPTFPKIEYEADLNIARNIYKTVSEYAEKLPEEYQNRARGFVSGLEYSIDNLGGYEGIIEEALNNTSMKAAYLVSKGEKVEEKQKTTISEMPEQQKKTCEKLLNAYGSKIDTLNGNESGKELFEALGNETKKVLVQNAITNGITEEEAVSMVDKLNKFQIVGNIRNAIKYRENKGVKTTTEVDVAGMNQDIANRVDIKEYEEWLRKLFKGVEKDSGLWNGKERYTPSGNMRSFKQTHIPFNVQNIVEAMLKQSDDVRNVAGFNGTKTIRAVVTEDFKSINEIKKAANTKLKNIDTNEYNKLRDELDERLYKVIGDIVDAKSNSDNRLTEMDTVGEIIIEACKNPTPENFKNTFQKYSRICTDAQAQEIADIVNAVASMPVNMFEAKPLRVVDFSEVAAVIVPKDTSEELIQKIKDNGMHIIEYEPGNEMERKEALNSINGVKFSLKSYADEIGIRFSDKNESDISEDIIIGTDSTRENNKNMETLVWNTAKILQEGVNAVGDIKKTNVSRGVCDNLASHYLQAYNADFDKDILSDNLYKIFAYIQKQPDNINYADMVRIMQEVCKPVVETSQPVDSERVQKYQNMTKKLKETPIKLTQGQKEEIADAYGSFERFHEANKGKYLIDNTRGSYLNDIWDSLVELSEGELSYSISDNDKMIELHRYMTNLQKGISVSTDTEQNAYDMALNVYTDYFRIINHDSVTVENLREQMLQELKDYKQKAAAYYKQNFQKIVQEQRLKKDAEIKSLQQRLKEAEFESAAARSRLEGAQEELKTVSQKEYEKVQNEVIEASGTIVDLNDEIVGLKKKIETIQKRNTEKIAQMQAQNYDSYINRHRAGKKTVLKNHIKRNMTDLQNRLAKPKENKYIPRQLVMATIDMCEAVNIDTGKSEKLSERFADLSRLYQQMKSDPDYALASEYNEQTAAAISRLQAVFKNRNITTLELEELEEVDGLVTQLHHQITNAGKLIRKEKAEDVYKTAQKCMEEIESSEGIKDDVLHRKMHGYITASLNAHRQFRRMSGYKKDSVLEMLYKDLDEGQLKQTQVLMDTAKMFSGVVEGKQNQKAVRRLTGKDKKDWIDIGLRYKDQTPVMVPRGFRVSLAMHMQNKSNTDHIIYGGLTIPDMDAYMRGDYETAYKTGRTIKFIPDGLKGDERQKAYNEAYRKLQSVISNMTPYEKEFQKIAEQFFHEYTTSKINETSLLLNGYKKARVNKYFPIKTDSNYTHAEIAALMMNGTIEGGGYLKNRVGARNPINLEDITQVVLRQSENVAKYYGMAIPVRNFKKIYNVTTVGYSHSTKEVIARKWGVKGQKFIEDLLTDIESHRGQEGTIWDKLQGNFAGATLTLNPSVTMKQAASYPTAAYTLGWDAVIKTLPKFSQKVDMDLIGKYTPLLWYRNQGNSTQELADTKKNGMLSDKISKLETELPEGFDKVPSALLNWIQAVDIKTVGTLWKACEYKVSSDNKQLKSGTDAYYKEVAKLFNQCVEDTQPNYTTLQRADIQRNPNKFMKQIVMFKTQPLQNFGILYDATMNLRAKAKAAKAAGGKGVAADELVQAKTDFARAVSSQLVAAAVFSAMTFASKALLHDMNRYRDDKDDITPIKMLDVYLGDMMSSIAGSALGGSELYSVLYATIKKEPYYGIEVSTVDAVSSVADDIYKLFTADDFKKSYVTNIIYDVSTLLGVPAKNVAKIFNGAFLHSVDFMNGEPLSYNAGFTSAYSVQYAKMFNYLADGDTDAFKNQYEKTIEMQMITKDKKAAESTVKSGIKGKLKESYRKGDISYSETVRILKEIGTEEDEIYFVIKAWDNADNDDYSKYSELQAAIESGKGIDEELKELTDNGVKEDNAMNTFFSLVKEAYQNGTISRKTAESYLLEYKKDFDEEKVYWQIREWDKADEYDKEAGEHYKQNDDLIQSIENGTFDTVVQEYLENGYDAKKIKSAITSVYGKQYKELYSAGKTHDAYVLREKLNKLRVNGRRLFGQDDYLRWNKAAKKGTD